MGETRAISNSFIAASERCVSVVQERLLCNTIFFLQLRCFRPFLQLSRRDGRPHWQQQSYSSLYWRAIVCIANSFRDVTFSLTSDQGKGIQFRLNR